MGKRKINTNPWLFPDADKKTLEENAFHLLSLYETMAAHVLSLLPEEERAQLTNVHVQLNGQRQALRQRQGEEGRVALLPALRIAREVQGAWGVSDHEQWSGGVEAAKEIVSRLQDIVNGKESTRELSGL